MTAECLQKNVCSYFVSQRVVFWGFFFFFVFICLFCFFLFFIVVVVSSFNLKAKWPFLEYRLHFVQIWLLWPFLSRAWEKYLLAVLVCLFCVVVVFVVVVLFLFVFSLFQALCWGIFSCVCCSCPMYEVYFWTQHNPYYLRITQWSVILLIAFNLAGCCLC